MKRLLRRCRSHLVKRIVKALEDDGYVVLRLEDMTDWERDVDRFQEHVDACMEAMDEKLDMIATDMSAVLDTEHSLEEEMEALGQEVFELKNIRNTTAPKRKVPPKSPGVVAHA